MESCVLVLSDRIRKTIYYAQVNKEPMVDDLSLMTAAFRSLLVPIPIIHDATLFNRGEPFRLSSLCTSWMTSRCGWASKRVRATATLYLHVQSTPIDLEGSVPQDPPIY